MHLRSYREDLGEMARPLGWMPEQAYRLLLNNRPLDPFIWSEVTLTPGATEPEGYIIMLPYSGRQLLEQQKKMQPLVRKAINLAVLKGAKVLGLGALTSPLTLGGKLVANQPGLAITNGNAYTSVIIYQKIAALLRSSDSSRPSVALVGASGSVGSLVALLLAKHKHHAELILIARNERRLARLASDISQLNHEIRPLVSQNINDISKADIVVMMTSSSDHVLQMSHMKYGATILDATQPRNVSQSALQDRQDITVIDGGLVSVNYLKTNQIGRLGLPERISFACLAETMILATADCNKDFSIGNPTLEQAATISKLASEFSHLGFGLAPDHCFGKPLASVASKLLSNAGHYF